jgi:two-component system, OmpR family, phosphate regulon response regulator PhoB
MSKSILLIHPDSRVQQGARALLSGKDYQVTEARELNLLEFGSPDLAIVDWAALNPVSESLRWLKQNGSSSELRLIVLADQSVYSEAVRSLEYGADDCIALPLKGDELLVRVKACFTRPQATPNAERLVAGPIVLDRRLHQVSIEDESLELAPTEFRLLAFFLENQGRVFSRNELLMRAWSANVKAGDRTVDVHVRRLRQQLERYRCEDMIQTVRGFGYRLLADDRSSCS